MISHPASLVMITDEFTCMLSSTREAVEVLNCCLESLKINMMANKLKLNLDKTEVLVMKTDYGLMVNLFLIKLDSSDS